MMIMNHDDSSVSVSAVISNAVVTHGEGGARKGRVKLDRKHLV